MIEVMEDADSFRFSNTPQVTVSGARLKIRLVSRCADCYTHTVISNFDHGGESPCEFNARLVRLADAAVNSTLSEAIAVVGVAETVEAMIAEFKSKGDLKHIEEYSRTLRALTKSSALLRARAAELTRTAEALRAHQLLVRLRGSGAATQLKTQSPGASSPAIARSHIANWSIRWLWP